MKIHITNIYNQNSDNQKLQHHFSDIARSLGFLEMGLFTYPVETDTDIELSKRLDGIIAGLEHDDIVFLQLPTGNGYRYEQMLIRKIKVYKNTKVILILHDMNFLKDNDYISLFKSADSLIIPSENDMSLLKSCGLSNILCYNHINSFDNITIDGGYLSLCNSGFYIKKTFMDAIACVYASLRNQHLSYNKNVMDEIHISFGLYDKTGNYSVWVGVAMQSIIEHTQSKLCFHILHDDTLNEHNRQRLTTVATSGNHRIQFHKLNSSQFSTLSKQLGHYTIGAMFRILLPEILNDLSRIIYLDADILVNRDIKELWDTDISDYCLAGVPDFPVISGVVTPACVKQGLVTRNSYFNSGVLYMNLDNIRTNGNMCTKIIEYLNANPGSKLPDQDALNTIYTNQTLLLDSDWNYFARNVHINGERCLLPKIYHYVGNRPIFYYHSEMDELYLKTTSRTPWGIDEGINQLRKSMQRTTDRIIQLEHLLPRLSEPNIKRIYYGEEIFPVKNMYKLLPPQKEDYRILSIPDNNDASILPCKPLSYISQETSPFVILVLPDADDGNAIYNLENMGLKNGVDFFNIRRILWCYDGGYL